MRRMVFIATLVCLTGTVALAGGNQQQATSSFQQDFPDVRLGWNQDLLTRVYGNVFGVGSSAELTAQDFVDSYADMFGVESENLTPGNQFDGAYTHPVMYQPDTGDYKFTLVYYAQSVDGIPVYRAELRLLTLNEPDHPLVWAGSSLRDLGDFTPAAAALANPAIGAAREAAAEYAPGVSSFADAELVIWAGINGDRPTPRTALDFVGSGVEQETGHYKKFRFVADAATGRILHAEDLIHFTDVTGNISGMATEGAAADICNDEVLTVMPHLQVSIVGGSSVYSDANGDFTIANDGTSAVTVQASMNGMYFDVDNYPGSEATVSISVNPPGPAYLIHSEDNDEEYVRAQVNGYVQSNLVRDWVLAANPAYPIIATETNFPVYVNRSDYYCPGNAWSDGVSINFCASGSGYPNTCWQSVIHHEYGHHAIDAGGSGQGAYGEGMADTFSMLNVDDPILGFGFYGTCDGGLRTADNEYQYPCSGEIHDCGQLLSGCIWSTRNELVDAGISNYLELLSGWAVNSIMLHSGTEITPQITIDFLTLDDNDGNIGNGTPHYPQICAGFGDHNMDCPELETGLSVSPTTNFGAEGPVGGPFTPASVNYTVENLSDYAIDYEVTVDQSWLDVTNGTGTLPISGTAQVTISFTSDAYSLPSGMHTATINFVNTTDNIGDTTRDVELGVGFVTAYEWTLDTNPGWTTEGQWAFGTPTGGGGDYGSPDPTSGYTGSNVYGYNLNGDYGSYLDEMALTSEAIDCTGLESVKLRFWRWLGVEQPSYDHAYVRVSNNGTSWSTVWENTEEVADSSWNFQELDISGVADNQSEIYLRWVMGETDVAWQYCGWNIDDITIYAAGEVTLPALTIALPGGTPAYVEPGVETPITVEIYDGEETYVADSALLHYRYDGATWNTAPLTHVAGNTYEATLPGASCSDTPEFYFSADGSGGTTVFSPQDAPTDLYSAGVGTLTVVMSDNFETDQGWTTSYTDATAGYWERGIPVNDASWEYDPAADADGSGQAYLTGNETGNSDVDGGSVTLTSPVFDMSSNDDLSITYYYFLKLTNTTGGVDMLRVDVSDDGGTNWTEVTRYTDDGGLSWHAGEVTAADITAAGLTLTDNMRIRFFTNDADPQSVNEAGIDAFVVSGFGCGDTWQKGDMNCDGYVNFDDIDPFIAAVVSQENYEEWLQTNNVECVYSNGDFDNLGGVNFDDIDPFVTALVGD